MVSAIPVANTASPHCAAIDTGFVALGPVKVAFLGVVQGITELLPVSSTAHMRAIPAFLGWPDPGSAFSAAMQLAALTAVIVYFRSDLGSMIRAGVDTVRKRDFDTPELSLAMGTLVATIPIAVAGAALSNILNQCQSPLRQPILIGTASVFVAGLMGAAEYFAKHKRPVTQFGYRDAILVGLAQVGALIPGVSRSGATLTASLALGFRREDAARVSFLLGVPAIALAGFHELWILHQSGLPARGWFALGIGLMVSSLSAFLAIWGLMRFLERHSTWMLILYRAAFGLLLIVAAAEGWIR